MDGCAAHTHVYCDVYTSTGAVLVQKTGSWLQRRMWCLLELEIVRAAPCREKRVPLLLVGKGYCHV